MSVFKINGLLVRAGEGITQPIGQSSARWQVLGRVYEPRSVAAMARDIGHARQSVQRIADELAEEGLVVYKDNPADRRARLLELTPEGAAVLNAIYLRQVEWSLRVMNGLNPAQLLEIADVLDDIGTVVKEEIEESDNGG
jgi:DNA-binding MarR family transcriptional regulator